MDLTRTEAFDMIADKIKAREHFTADLVARASDGSTAGYLRLEQWINSKKYSSRVNSRVLTYYCSEHEAAMPGGVSYRKSSRPVR